MWYLCVFYHRLLDYRRPEVQSLAELFGGPGAGDAVEWRMPENHHEDSPFHLVRLPGDERLAAQIANRIPSISRLCRTLHALGLLVKGIFELWGQGATYDELEKAIREYPDERKLPYLTPESSFKIVVDSFGKVISFEEQNEIIKGFTYIPFEGRVNLKKPEHKFFVLETDDYGSQNGLPPVVQKTVFFGREVGAADRHLLPTYQLKSRKYIGPTAMDCEMAFLMANQGLARTGKLVYDPFVGTGSILVAAAHFGAMTMFFQGADIDIRVVRDGRGPDCNIWSNFEQYKLPEPLCVLRADNNLPPWRPGLKEIFDAIICDPPYGVRAGGRKSGGRKLLKGIIPPYTVPDEKRENHIPSTAPYSLAECVHDLLHLAARMLVVGGRLVFFYPMLREDDAAGVAKFPEHPCFKLVSSCEQILSLRYSRVLLTMVKVGPYTEEVERMGEERHQEFRENHQKWMEEGNLHTAVFSPAEHDKKPESDRGSKPKYRGKFTSQRQLVQGTGQPHTRSRCRSDRHEGIPMDRINLIREVIADLTMVQQGEESKGGTMKAGWTRRVRKVEEKEAKKSTIVAHIGYGSNGTSKDVSGMALRLRPTVLGRGGASSQQPETIA
uniref:tRNA (guanine(10)-N(2))-methyltransferase n=1 Tax=Aegilops tauschii TaxID=37682 RepID=R7W1E7_AEGTA